MSFHDRLTKADILAAFKTLSAVYTESRALMRMRESGIEIWLETLTRARVTSAELTEAVKRYIGSEAQYWPKPGDLIKHARMARDDARATARPSGSLAEYQAWERRSWRTESLDADAPCPVCGAMPEWAPQLVVKHDHQVHYEAGIGYSGPRTGPVTLRNGTPVMMPAKTG